jgi:hypothetical protein
MNVIIQFETENEYEYDVERIRTEARGGKRVTEKTTKRAA